MTTINSNIEALSALGSSADKASLVSNMVQATKTGDTTKLLAAGNDAVKLILFYAEVVGKATGNASLINNSIAIGNQYSTLNAKLTAHQTVQLGDILSLIGSIADFGGDLALTANKVPVLAPILPEINTLAVALKASSVLIGYSSIVLGSLTVSEGTQVVDATRAALNDMQQSNGSTSSSITINIGNNSTTLSNNSAGSNNASFTINNVNGQTVTTRLNANLEPIETATIYTVKSGDTLSGIAQKNNIPISVLQAANRQITNPNEIFSGENLYIPLAVHNTGNTWTVGQGATIDVIAFATGLERWQIQAANIGVDLDKLSLGQALNLPSVNNGLIVSTSTTPASTLAPSSNGVPANSDNSTILGQNGGVIHVQGIGNVNTVSGTYAFINEFISNGFRPGNFNLNTSSYLFDFNSINFIGYNSAGLALGANALNNASSWLSHFLPVDPLVLDLNGDGVRLTNFKDSPVLFDIDHDIGATKEQTGWVDTNDGLLVYDVNSNGAIDNISEMFSEYFNAQIGTKAYRNGLHALKDFDSNSNNKFDSSDAQWNNVKVWVDSNHDGKSWIDTNNNGIFDSGEGSELKTLASLNITSIDLNETKQSGLVRDGNEVLASSTFVQNGVIREVLAANFIANPNGSTFSSSGSGTVTTTEGNVKNYTSGDAGETISVAQKGVNNAQGGIGDDTLIGDSTANWLTGGLGADTINAGAGDDVILFDSMDTIDGGDGTDIAQVVGDAGVILNLSKSHVEVVVGGRGDDILIGGGRNTVFIKGGEGQDIIIGGAANDVLSGEDGSDLIDGGAGNDLVRGHRGRDNLIGGSGDDIMEGGQDDDQLNGGDGNDVIEGGEGADTIDGGNGVDILKFAGSYANYRFTKLNDNTWRVSDTTGRDGTDIFKNIETLSFSDLKRVSFSNPAPLPVRDTITKNSSNNFITRTSSQLISKEQLLANDLDRDSDVSTLVIDSVGDGVGGTPTLVNGNVVFNPDPNFKGIMSFSYVVRDGNGYRMDLTDGVTGLTGLMKGIVVLKTPEIPNDPLVIEQTYLSKINVLPVWSQYTGKGVRIGQFELSGDYAIEKEVFDYRNPELSPNTDNTWLSNPNTPKAFSEHATKVASIMVAAKNGEGMVGIAYDAKLSGFSIGTPGGTTPDWTILNEWKNYDVVNNSWGPDGNFPLSMFAPQNAVIGDAMLSAVQDGRNGLGTIIVFANGNARVKGQDANQSPTNLPYSIQVSAINYLDDVGTLTPAQAPFSNRGASILVSAPGTNITALSREIENSNGALFGSDSDKQNGTSLAAPMVSGVVALMLEANPNLGYRDVQEILALSATKVSTAANVQVDWVDNGAKNWNGGGMHVSHDYGFGLVDARAAVRLAETWVRTGVINNGKAGVSNLAELQNGVQAVNVTIPDNGVAYTQNITIGTNVSVEQVQVALRLNHPNYGDLVVKLISPSGTESILMNREGNGVVTGTGELLYMFTSTHHWGELSGGVWKVQVSDKVSGNVGTIQAIDLRVMGKQAAAGDSDYFYTDEFSTLGAGARLSLAADTDGGIDTINAAAVTNGITVNLTTGSANLVGKAVTIISSASIENVIGGESADVITGNASTNRLVGGMGADSLNGASGQDILEGGLGNDALTGGADTDIFVFRKDPNSVDVITDFNVTAGERILIVGFGDFKYQNINLVQDGLNTKVNLANGQSIVLNNVTAGTLAESNFAFLDKFNFSRSLVGTNAPDNMFYQDGTILNEIHFAGAGNDTVFGSYGLDLIYGENGDDLLVGDPGNEDPFGAGDTIFGGAGQDTIYGGYGDDVLHGDDGNDFVIGGAGNDTIYLEGDVYTNTAAYYVVGSAGNDLFKLTNALFASPTAFYNLISDFEVNNPNEKVDLTAITSVTSFSQLILQHVDVNNTGYISTRVKLGAAIDAPSLILYGIQMGQISANNFIFSKPLETKSNLVGTAGSDYLTGTLSSDVMEGRTGDDTYVVNSSLDQINELRGGGHDTVLSSASRYYLPGEVEVLILTAGDSNSEAFGNALSNRIVGNSGDNTLDGGAGSDDLVGGAGHDKYIVDVGTDRITENADEGYDLVESSVSWTLGQNLENLTLTGVDNINATGNAQINVLIGNSGDNTLDGAQGADIMQGGNGDDTYFIDNVGDVVTENLNQGIDIIYTSVNLGRNLDANVESAILFGTATTIVGNDLDNRLIGNDLVNSLNGGKGNDYLDGGLGSDTLVGGEGNDTYIYDGTDIITEALNGGIDTVQSSVTYTLGANLENLTLTGTQNFNGTGNSSDNVIIGSSGNNTLTGGSGNDTLNGGGGVDTLIGGDGNDVYIVDSTTDTIAEISTGGVDTVQSSVTYTLGASSNLENLTLTGSAEISATGNTLNNVITGNAAANTLNGGSGVDTLIGGDGDDLYTVDSTTDTIIEIYTGGVDSVQSSVTFTLGSNVENLILSGTSIINGNGNSLNNDITGNDAANTLDGGYGSDVLRGGLGDDVYLVGKYQGKDFNYYASPGEPWALDIDEIVDQGGADKIIVGAYFYDYSRPNGDYFSPRLTAVRTLESGQDNLSLTLMSDVIGDGGGSEFFEKVKIRDYFAVGDKVEQIKFVDSDYMQMDTLLDYFGYEFMGSSGDDVMLATNRAYAFSAGAGNDYMRGINADQWFGLASQSLGNDIMQGLGGIDSIEDIEGNNIFDGGDDLDIISSGYEASSPYGSKSILIGGRGDDFVFAGNKSDIILFNKGDGKDELYLSKGSPDVISLGGTFSYNELSLSKSGADLVLRIGANDQLTLKQWYQNPVSTRPQLNLQVIAESVTGFVRDSATDLIRNDNVEQFNFSKIISEFDQAGGPTNWTITDTRLRNHLISGSDDLAWGGDVAYQYGRNGNLAGLGLSAAQAVINDTNFAVSKQTLHSASTWASETIKLA